MANDETIRVPSWTTGKTLYTIIESGLGPFNKLTSQYESYNSANRNTAYNNSTPETPAGSQRYVCQFPVASTPGYYTWTVFEQAGASPDITDEVIGTGSGFWDGSTFGGSSSVSGDVGGVSGGIVLASNGLDSVILEAASGSKPEINARIGLSMIFNAAPGGLISGVNTSNPIKIYNPNGDVLRMTVTADPSGNRTSVEFNNLP